MMFLLWSHLFIYLFYLRVFFLFYVIEQWRLDRKTGRGGRYGVRLKAFWLLSALRYMLTCSTR